MFHGPAAAQGKDPASAFKMRLGAWMFLLYALTYGGFVAINLADPKAMDQVVLMGLNLAVVYGFGLILFALFLAVIYTLLCSRREALLAGKEDA